MKRIYISGAITGTDDFCERFAEAEDNLSCEGLSIVNPAKLNNIMPKDATYDEYMKMSFKLLGMCDAIYMLKGWEERKEPFAVVEIETEDDFNMLQKAIEQYKKQNGSGWISVEDRLPKDEDDVLVLVREVEHYGMCKEKTEVYRYIFTGWYIDGVWATTYCHGHKRIEDENKKYPDCEHTVTHWMPLPELPKEVLE